MTTTAAWWQDAVFYQVYPRSFSDGNGDGIGDLPGITARLIYVAETGFDAIWLSPFYRSPMADFGYDVSDLTGVDPVFGTLADFDRLLAEAHRLGLRVIVDFVPSHTSIQHPWFLDARSSRTSAHRDWYVWHDGAPDGGPPNNWQSQFPRVGSGWTFDEPTRQWYLHSYLPDQPDLDWGNPTVVAAMSDVLRFWLRRGVDGFRIDVPQRLGKDALFRDNPGLVKEPDSRFVGRRFDEDQDVVLERLRAIRSVADEFPGTLLVGEVYVLDQRRMARYVNGPDVLDLAHNFQFLRLPWEAGAFRATIAELEVCLAPDTWPAWCLGNHDHSRIVSRFGADGRGEDRARLVAMLLLTLRGTPFIYQGDELGLPDSIVPPHQVLDIHDRDRVRGPLPWSPPSVAGPGAGFSTATPWLPITAEAERLSVSEQTEDLRSMLSLVRSLLAVRRATPSLRSGSMTLMTAPADVLAYERCDHPDRFVIAINFGVGHVAVPLPAGAGARLVVSTDPDRSRGAIEGSVSLSGLEGCILQMGGEP